MLRSLPEDVDKGQKDREEALRTEILVRKKDGREEGNPFQSGCSRRGAAPEPRNRYLENAAGRNIVMRAREN